VHTARRAAAEIETQHTRTSYSASHLWRPDPGGVHHVEASLVIMLVHKGSMLTVNFQFDILISGVFKPTSAETDPLA